MDVDNWREQFTGSGDPEKDEAFQTVLGDYFAALDGDTEAQERFLRGYRQED